MPAARQKRAIRSEEYVRINGIEQYLFHSGADHGNPVMLFLHGGPGAAASVVSHVFQDKWEEIYTVVHWDQRGAGKTLVRNPDKRASPELLLQDLLEIVQYLKTKYGKPKVVVLGHSWGTVLGTLFVQRHPEEVAYYIGVGQVVNKLENERIGYAKVRERIVEANDQKSLKLLESVGEYPGDRLDDDWLSKSLKIRELQSRYHLTSKSASAAFRGMLRSPIFRLSDISAMFRGATANKDLMRVLADFDLRTAEYAMPVYYVVGDNDWQTPCQTIQKYHERVVAPRTGFYVVPEAGHMAMIDQPERFARILADIHNACRDD
jgi:pimeloyl-ACP methyl ester carboxylesterase